MTRPRWLVHLHLIRDAVAPTTRSLMCMIEMAPSGPKKYVGRRDSDVIRISKDMRQRGVFPARTCMSRSMRVCPSVSCVTVWRRARADTVCLIVVYSQPVDSDKATHTFTYSARQPVAEPSAPAAALGRASRACMRS